MVNNDFHVFGIAVSNYQELHSGNYVSYTITVEVEKMNSKNGKNFELEFVVYGTNKAVDTQFDVMGHQVAVNGYLDSFTTKEGIRITKLVAQNVFILDKGKPVQISKNAVSNDPKEEVICYDAPTSEQDEQENIQMPDDDLPF